MQLSRYYGTYTVMDDSSITLYLKIDYTIIAQLSLLLAIIAGIDPCSLLHFNSQYPRNTMHFTIT